MVIMIDKSKIAANKTQALFLELNGWDSEEAVYTLGDEDVVRDNGKHIYSIRKLYVEMGDVHEYNFATTYFASWKHWNKMLDSPRVRPYIDDWRAELAAKIQSDNLKRMQTMAADGDKQAVRYLADRGWEGAPVPKKRGRPSKEEVAGELKQSAREAQRIEDDFNRIMQ